MESGVLIEHVGLKRPLNSQIELDVGVRSSGERSGPEMRVRYLKLHLLATCVPTLWLMVFLLEQKSSQNDLRKMPGNHSKTCDCPQNSLRKCICSSEVHECSTCLGIPGESVWFDERFEMDVEPLMRSEVPMSFDALL